MTNPTFNIKHYLLPVLFIGTIGLHFIDNLFPFINEPAISETRTKTEKPKPNPKFLDPYPKKFEAYYNDYFNWRNYFVKASTYLNYYTFKKSALPDQVLIGKNGWLFKSGHQLDVYRGKFRFSRKELEAIKRELERRKKTVEALGGKYYLAIPPLKHHIYAEFLPDNVKQINTETCTQQLVNYLREENAINYIDLFQPILESKKKDGPKLYLTTDHHWTQYSSFIAAKTVLDRLREDFPTLGKVNEANYELDVVEYDGMLLAQMLGLEKEMKEQFPIFKYKKKYTARDTSYAYPAPHDFPFPDEYAIGKWTGKTTQPTLFMVRESFASHMIDILGEHFESSFFLFDNWKHQFNEAIYKAEPADIYVQFIWEGLLFQLMEYPPEDAGW